MIKMKTTTTMELATALGVTNESLVKFMQREDVSLVLENNCAYGYLTSGGEMLEFFELNVKEVVQLLQSFYNEDGCENFEIVNILGIIERLLD